MPQLASVDDVIEFLGRDLTPEEGVRVEPILDKASELFRLESGQKFLPGESETRLRVRGGSEVFLPQRPVLDVTSVTDDDGNDLPFTFRGQVVRITDRTHVPFAIVTYSHGGVVPDVVRTAVAEIGAVVLRVDEAALGGITQVNETTGPFSRQASYAAWAVGGATRLSPDDVRLARSLRNPWRQVVALGS